jgi:hypothetical protein
MATERDETAQIRTRRAELGRPTPRRFTHTGWLRFARDRRRRYLARIPGGQPSDRQVGQVDAMVRLEWQAHKAEALGTLQADREAREFRRLLDRFNSDYEKSLIEKPAPAPSFAEHWGKGRTDEAA